MPHLLLVAALLAPPELPPAAPPETPPAPPPEAPPGFSPGWLPTLVAAGPGLIVHGLGHMVAGDTDTGLDLLIAEGAGLGLIIGGTAVLAATGASRRIAGPNVIVIGAGFGLFTTSWLGDIVGANGGVRGNTRQPTPPFALHVGHRYIHDPQWAYAQFAVVGVDGQYGRLGHDADAWIALDDDNWRARNALRWRLLGDPSGGSHLDALQRIGWHHHGTEGFAFLTLDAELGGRWDLGDRFETLSGSFFEGGVGWSLEMYRYDVPGTDFPEDIFDQLLYRFGYGIYLGRGELALLYDHRRDSFAQGLGLDGIGVGAIGSVGLRGRWWLNDTWGIDADYAVGSAHVLGVSLRWASR